MIFDMIFENVYLLIVLACVALAVVIMVEKSKPSPEKKIRDLEEKINHIINHMNGGDR